MLCNNAIMPNMLKIRNIILKEMKRSGLTIYRVAKMVEGKIPQRTVYDYLSGTKDTGTETASIIMDALGLTVTNKSNVKKGRGPRKEKA